MWHIFGDTDDITFGSSIEKTTPLPKKEYIPAESRKPQGNNPYPRPLRTRSTQAPSVPQIARNTPETSLSKLIESMKPTYLPQGDDTLLRIVFLSPASHSDPCMILRGGDMTFLLGTGFSMTESAGITYHTIPDMRLAQSEKPLLSGWILREPWFHIESFQMILDMLDFPFVYGTRDVIAYIRNSIKDSEFLDKCRFFEIFPVGTIERKIGDFTLKNTREWLSFTKWGRNFVDGIHTLDASSHEHATGMLLTRSATWYEFASQKIHFTEGEIIDIATSRITKNQLKFTFDTFYRDHNSVWVVAGYTLKDRAELGANGVLTFVLEEDVRARAIVWHIFIDSRGFVHSYEMMSVHKDILKWIRHTYEQAILANPRIERGELVQTFRREITKYCYLLTGRTPVVMPVIIER